MIVADLAQEARGEGLAAMEAAREAKARAAAQENNAIKATGKALALQKMAIAAAGRAAARAEAARTGQAIRNSNSSSSSSSSSYKSYKSFLSEKSDVDDDVDFDLVSYHELQTADGPEMLRDEQNLNLLRQDTIRQIHQMNKDTRAWIRSQIDRGKEPTFASFKRTSAFTRTRDTDTGSMRSKQSLNRQLMMF